jgi:Svf1-like N-terminal lipocalin domain
MGKNNRAGSPGTAGISVTSKTHMLPVPRCDRKSGMHKILIASFIFTSYNELVQADVSRFAISLLTCQSVAISLTVPASSLANVAGTQEPEYGPSAIQSVAAQAQTIPYTEVTTDDLKWKAMESTCVETQTFYFMTDEGVWAMAQVIYSNVGYKT